MRYWPRTVGGAATVALLCLVVGCSKSRPDGTDENATDGSWMRLDPSHVRTAEWWQEMRWSGYSRETVEQIPEDVVTLLAGNSRAAT